MEVFRTHLNIYVGIFWQKKLTAESLKQFFRKGFNIDYRLGFTPILSLLIPI